MVNSRAKLAPCTLGTRVRVPRHGGAGALYVLLRKFKKIKGKVRWENFWDRLD